MHMQHSFRRPYKQATTASGVIQNLELWKVSIQIHREVAGLMLSLSDMRKAFFHLIQPVVHDELFDFALKLAKRRTSMPEQSLKRILLCSLNGLLQNFMG